jgi:hypothetical protein
VPPFGRSHQELDAPSKEGTHQFGKQIIRSLRKRSSMLPKYNLSFFIRLSYVRNDYPHDRGVPLSQGTGMIKVIYNIAAKAGEESVVTLQSTTKTSTLGVVKRQIQQ